MAADLLLWIILLEALAWASFVIAWPLFSRWPDRGFGLSKCTAIFAISAPAWTLAWTGLPSLSRSASWTLGIFLLAVAVLVAHRQRAAIAGFLRTNTADWAVSEFLWLLSFAVFLLLRAARPAIEGTEKFMDFAFLNAAMRGATLPLEDPWLSGAGANYHYFGYVAWALPARMLNVPSSLAYNLSLASIPAAVAAGAFSISLSLTRRRWIASAASMFLVFGGTLACAYQLVIAGRPFDTWAPSRVIAGTINEFPFFTFIWGDLHSHLLAMPSLVLFLGLMVVLFAEEAGRRSLVLMALLGAASGLSLVTATWDAAPIALAGAGILWFRSREFGIRRVVPEAIAAAAVALPVALPALLSVHAGPMRAGVTAARSPLGSFLLVQGLWLLPTIVLLAKTASSAGPTRGVAIIAAVSLAGFLATRSTTVFLLAILLMLASRELRRAFRVDRLLIAASLVLLLIAELVFVDDIYGPDLQRMNTVFKLHLHATIMLGLAAAPIALELWESSCSTLWRTLLAGMAVTATLLAAAYPIGAIRLWLTEPAWTLDGTRHLEKNHPGDLAVIEYLNRDAAGRPAILEATGEPYSYASRISANTGLPTIVGWANHERVWRRDPQMVREIARRVDVVRTAYDGDAREARTILKAFHVRYVVVGDLERRMYPNGDFAKFDVVGRKLLDVAGTQLFEIDSGIDVP